MKKLASQFLLSLMVMPVVSLALAVPVAAQPTSDDFWGGGDPNRESADVRDEIEGTLILGDRDPREIAASVINIILGFLGIVAVIIILAGGFKWMTASGNQDKVDEAKKLMSAGIIGLIIVLAAFGIARFIIDALVDATQGS